MFFMEGNWLVSLVFYFEMEKFERIKLPVPNIEIKALFIKTNVYSIAMVRSP